MLIPRDAYVLIKPDTPGEDVKRHFSLPVLISGSLGRGIVVSVGPGRTHDNGTVSPITLRVGDRVIYERSEIHEITHEGDRLCLMREWHIIAVEDSHTDAEPAKP